MKKVILITGGAGFVGANLAVFLKKNLKDYHIVCFDSLIRKGSNLNLVRLKNKGIDFVKGDIRHLQELLALPKVDIIIDCSAEPSVLASYNDPQYMIDTNLMGTINCLHLAMRDRADFIFLSTSRVYSIEALNSIPYEEKETRFDITQDYSGIGCSFEGVTADFSLKGIKSLYGATKLSSEYIIQEFLDMYGLRGVIDRFGVIAGPWQMGKVDQGIVGFWVAQHYFGGKLNYIGYGGTGKQIRDAIHVDDACELILWQIKNLNKVNGKVFNVGGGRKNTFSLLELTNLTQDITDKRIHVASIKEERKSDIRIYITNNCEITNETNWTPVKTLEDTVRDIYLWIKENEKHLKEVLL